jgi:SAM-dependent methyltransferase
MLLPRYLLREDVVVRAIARQPAHRVADIGCGGAEILVALGRRGFTGVGYDVSAVARDHARARLAAAGESGFRIVDAWPEGERFGTVLVLEVLGYVPDPVAFLIRCRELLWPGGSLLLSFTPPSAGYNRKVVQGMTFFTPAEVRALLESAGFSAIRITNYGFPLANALVGVMNTTYRLRLAVSSDREARETGLGHAWSALRPLGLVSNRWTLKPFILAQRLFTQTELGNGFVVEASAPRTR